MIFCKSINLPYNKAETIQNFGGGTGQILQLNLMCRGDETQIDQCQRGKIIKPTIGEKCSHQ